MHIRVVELLANLLPTVVEDILAFSRREVLELALVLHGFRLVLTDLYLLDSAAGNDIETLAVGGREEAAENVLRNNFHIAFAEVQAAKVVGLFQTYAVVEFATVGSEPVVAQAAGMAGKTNYTVFPAAEFQLHRIRLAFCRLGTVFGLFLVFLLLLLRSLDELLYLLHVFALAELRVGLVIEEHQEDVAFGAPAAVAAVAGLVALPGHSLAAERPAEIAVAVAAFGEVRDGAALYVDKGDVVVIHTAAALIGGEDAAAVGTPGEGHVAVGIGGIGTLEKGFRMLAVGGGHNYFGTVAEVGYALAVGRCLRLEAYLPFGADTAFLEA